MRRIAIVTGGSSGIGKETVLALRDSDYTVYELSRHEMLLDGVHHICADVTDESSLQKAVEQVLKNEGKIDLLVNNAGFGISGAVEYTSVEEAQKQLDVNFFGMVRMNHSVIPVMRQQGYGCIINITSVASPVPIPFQAFYSASKAAAGSYSRALSNELRPYGIKVVAIQPGDIKTGFTKAREKNTQGDEQYQGRISRSVRKMEHDEQTGMDPAVAGRFIAKIAQKRHPKCVYSIGLAYSACDLLIRLLPYRFGNWLIYQLYAK